MKRQSWNDKQLDRLKAELASKGNTKEAWMELCDFHDLPAMQAGELAAQCSLHLQAEEPGFVERWTKVIGETCLKNPTPPAAPARVASSRKFTPLKKNA